jgi:hypothetical protein
MSIRTGLIVAILLTVTCTALSAGEYRSREVTREFQREHPCPSTGKTNGVCPGYRKDHIKPLACGGPDAVSNLQWQTIADAKAKDRWERGGLLSTALAVLCRFVLRPSRHHISMPSTKIRFYEARRNYDLVKPALSLSPHPRPVAQRGISFSDGRDRESRPL